MLVLFQIFLLPSSIYRFTVTKYNLLKFIKTIFAIYVLWILRMLILLLSASQASLNENGHWLPFHEYFSAHCPSPEPAQ